MTQNQKILILGSDGMLGSTCYKVLNEDCNLEVEGTSRLPTTNKIYFDVFNQILSDIEWTKYDYIINCIGMIKQKIKLADPSSVLDTVELNTRFPAQLGELCSASSTRIIQIATDCVFSGKKGSYSESDKHDATDLYGITKSLGEINAPNFMNIRSSIIGKENTTSYSLLEWLLSSPKNAEIPGYVNHYWNGVTTLHFSKVVRGIIQQNLFKPGLAHLVPPERISKQKLLLLIRQYFQRLDLQIDEFVHETSVDRTLTTLDPSYNQKLWHAAGYNFIPTIEQMVEEYSRF